MNDKELFRALVKRFNEQYPKRNINICGTLVYVDGECVFNTDGFNLLYNVTRLSACLKDELR